MQGIDLCATVVVLVTVGVVAGDSVGLVIGLPGVRTARGHCECRMHRIVDGQMQRVNLRAAMGILMAVGVVAALGVGNTVTASPGVGATFGYRNGGMNRREDGQVQRIDLRAAISILMAVGVVAALGVGNAGAASPGVGTAFGYRNGGVCRREDGQM